MSTSAVVGLFAKDRDYDNTSRGLKGAGGGGEMVSSNNVRLWRRERGVVQNGVAEGWVLEGVLNSGANWIVDLRRMYVCMCSL